MRRVAFFLVVLSILAPLAAAPARKPTSKPAVGKPSAEAKLIQSCEAHKFEAVVETSVDGQPHKSKVKLCGVEGQTDGEWIETLQDAIRKLQANKEMAPTTRDQIVAAIKAEIGRLSIVQTPMVPKREAQEQGGAPLSRDYAALPPLPPAPTAVAPAPRPAEEPIAAAPIVAAPAVSAAVSVPRPALALPRFTISCESPTDVSGPGPCAEFERETRITVRADAEVPQGARLEFVRNGQTKAELALGGITRSTPLRSSLPPSICSGFGAGRLELRIVAPGGAEATQTDGPFPLRC